MQLGFIKTLACQDIHFYEPRCLLESPLPMQKSQWFQFVVTSTPLFTYTMAVQEEKPLTEHLMGSSSGYSHDYLLQLSDEAKGGWGWGGGEESQEGEGRREKDFRNSGNLKTTET